MKASRVWWLAFTVLIGHCLFAWVTWQMISARGLPPGQTSFPVSAWFGIVGASAFVVILIRVLCSRGAVAAWNLPEKERFLKLPQDKQIPVAEIMLSFGALSAICVVLVFVVLQAGLFSIAMGHTQKLPWWSLAGVGVLPVCLLLALIPWSRSISAAIDRAETTS